MRESRPSDEVLLEVDRSAESQSARAEERLLDDQCGTADRLDPEPCLPGPTENRPRPTLRPDEPPDQPDEKLVAVERADWQQRDEGDGDIQECEAEEPEHPRTRDR